VLALSHTQNYYQTTHMSIIICQNEGSIRFSMLPECCLLNPPKAASVTFGKVGEIHT